MKGFLRKDWYLVKDYWLPYIPILLFACLVPGTWGGTYILMLALALPRGPLEPAGGDAPLPGGGDGAQ